MTEPAERPNAPSILRAEGLVKRYRRGGETVTPVRGVDLEIRPGTVTGLVGPSGAGKSTLARLLTLHEAPDEGRLLLAEPAPVPPFGKGGLGGIFGVRGKSPSNSPFFKGGEPRQRPSLDPWQVTERERRGLRRRLQLVAQDPVESVQPRWSVERAVAEPLAVVGAPRKERRARVQELLATVGLGELASVAADRRALDLSGGQLQRLVLARALACAPRLLVLDETLTGLDLSLQARTVGLLIDLLEDRRDEMAVVLVSHDLRLVRHLADRIVRLD